MSTKLKYKNDASMMDASIKLLKEVDIQKALSKNDLNEFYKIAIEFIELGTIYCPDNIGDATQMLFNFGIDIFDYIDYIPPYCFFYTSLEYIEIPKHIKHIDEDAFSYCDITKITIPSNVETVGSFAFHDCDDLKLIKFEKGVKKIGDFAFNGTGGTIVIPESTNTSLHVFGGCTAKILREND